MEFDLGGARAFAATGGRPFDPNRPVLALIHGAGMDHTAWVLQARYFAHHGRSVLAFDLPGRGKSAGPALGSVEAMAAWLWRALDALGAKRAALVGHSMGSMVALEAAAMRPEAASHLGLIGTNYPMAVAKPLLDAAVNDPPAAHAMITGWGHGPAAKIGGHPVPGLWMTGGALRLLERNPPGVLAADFAACNAYRGAEAAMARVTCPAKLILGANDQMTPAGKSDLLLKGLKRATKTVLPDCGHMLMVEQPDGLLAALKELLD
ncbi:MAG: alpha/beta hydrolase [Alphaproteobacteria bacterium]|nr:alpha/beta hydrolase [Alphaproteobacteria bacterium]